MHDPSLAAQKRTFVSRRSKMAKCQLLPFCSRGKRPGHAEIGAPDKASFDSIPSISTTCHRLTNKRKVLHSLRHRAQDRLRAFECPAIAAGPCSVMRKRAWQKSTARAFRCRN